MACNPTNKPTKKIQKKHFTKNTLNDIIRNEGGKEMIKNLEEGLFGEKGREEQLLENIFKEIFKGVIEQEVVGNSLIAVMIENEREIGEEMTRALRLMMSGMELAVRNIKGSELEEKEAKEIGRIYRLGVSTLPVKVKYKIFYFQKKENDIFVMEI